MLASVNKTPEDEIDNNTSFHFCNNFGNERNIGEKVIGMMKVIDVFKKM